MAAKDNAHESSMDKTSFWWAGLCAICHPGGGPTELDRDGHLYFDPATGQFGYQQAGKTAGDVTYDGDYAEINHMSGAHRAAPWDVTGVSEPDCLYCHRAAPSFQGGVNWNWVWRAATLRAKDGLQSSGGASVPAYAAAATAGQGWATTAVNFPPGKPPIAASVDIDYGLGLGDGSLTQSGGQLYVAETHVARTPKDMACWGCHFTPDLKKRGRSWFDPAKDVHYAAFNPGGDPTQSTACAECHPAGPLGPNHNIAKGNATLGSVRNDTDYMDFRTCRDCHLPGPEQHPQAPAPESAIHSMAPSHLAKLSCEFCHIPYKHDPADLVVDNATTGATMGYNTAAFLSEDPLDPGAADADGRWWPAFEWKTDRDGVRRLFPMKRLLSIWWGDWDQKGTPLDLDDDVIAPLALWRVRQITGGGPLPVVTDDGADSRLEVNNAAEILAYIQALRGNDAYGRPVAANPVLVKGGRIWYEAAPGVLDSFAYHDTQIRVESSHPFSINHNVLAAQEALGSGGCTDCHNGEAVPTPVFDRLILVDPFDLTGAPVYETVRDLTELDPW